MVDVLDVITARNRWHALKNEYDDAVAEARFGKKPRDENRLPWLEMESQCAWNGYAHILKEYITEQNQKGEKEKNGKENNGN
jgi:hypothetical protein